MAVVRIMVVNDGNIMWLPAIIIIIIMVDDNDGTDVMMMMATIAWRW